VAEEESARKDAELEALRSQLDLAASDRERALAAEESARRAEAELEALHSKLQASDSQQDVLVQKDAELEELRQQFSKLRSERDHLAERVAQAPSTGSVDEQVQEARRDAAQAVSERNALEEAFRSRMEQVQRNLSAKTIEAETLRRQLQQAQAASTSQPDGPASFDISTPRRGRSPSSSSERSTSQAADDDDATRSFNRQLQGRIQAVEEEKATMLSNLREHVMQLARENYDLKHGNQASQPRQKASEGSPDASAEPESRNAMPPGSEESAQAPSGAAAQGAPPAGGGAGSWLLSTLLSPFLTDSDMREIHAESYVDENLGRGSVS